MDLSSQNNGFGPLCKPRSETLLLIVAVSSIATFLGLVEVTVSVLKPKKFLLSYKNTEPIHLLSIYCAMTSSLILGEILTRLTLFVEEVRYANERHNGSRLKALKRCMNFGKRTKVSELFIHVHKRSFVVLVTEKKILVKSVIHDVDSKKPRKMNFY